MQQLAAQQGQQHDTEYRNAMDFLRAKGPMLKEWTWNWCHERQILWYTHIATWGPRLELPAASRAAGH